MSVEAGGKRWSVIGTLKFCSFDLIQPKKGSFFDKKVKKGVAEW